MSRIGKLPVTLPQGVTAQLDNNQVTITGPKGNLTQQISPEVSVKVEEGQIVVSPSGTDKKSSSMWGLYRTLLANMVVGVTEGYTRHLELHGVGYRASMQGTNLQLSVGFSHPVIMTPPEGIAYTVNENTKITVSGIDKQLVGESAAKIRAARPPEPYKGKGVRYAGEQVRRKAGKAAKAVGK